MRNFEEQKAAFGINKLKEWFEKDCGPFRLLLFVRYQDPNDRYNPATQDRFYAIFSVWENNPNMAQVSFEIQESLNTPRVISFCEEAHPLNKDRMIVPIPLDDIDERFSEAEREAWEEVNRYKADKFGWRKAHKGRLFPLYPHEVYWSLMKNDIRILTERGQNNA